MDGEVGQPEEVGPDDHGPERVPRKRVGVEAATTNNSSFKTTANLYVYAVKKIKV